MSTHGWQRCLLSDTTSSFVAPYPPVVGQTVEISLLVPANAPVQKATLRSIQDGIDHHHAMDREITHSGSVRLLATFTYSQREIHYHFVLTDDDGDVWYFTREGITSVYPDERSDFSLDSVCDSPSWVAHTVLYQIFPDRFARGDESLGVRNGEIQRDGFESKMMSWDSEPLSYPEGGSLDFFNGDLSGIAQRLDYLEELGVNALYLNPIFTAKTNHRYDCLDYFSVDAHLGGDEALAALSRACHERHMRLMLDVSINHIGVEHPWAHGIQTETGPVQVVLTDGNGEPVHWMGVPELLKLDYRVGALRDRIYRDPDSLVQRYLKPPFSIDGWRFDVASETGNFGTAQLGNELWTEIRSVIKRVAPHAYVVGEHWQDATIYLQGGQWDSAMNYFGAGRPLRMWLGEQDRFAVEPQREGVPGKAISGHELGRMICRHFDRLPGKLINTQFNLFDSHDVGRAHLNEFVDFDRYAGAVALLFFLPGTPSIYYGDELEIDGHFDGDHGKRYPMPWDSARSRPRSYELYRELAAAKRSEHALQTGTLRILDSGDPYLALARVCPEQSLLLLLNRGPKQTLKIPRGPASGSRAQRLAVLGYEEAAVESSDTTVKVTVDEGRSVILRLS